ncbi:MAG: iron ABC transporter permease [Alloprevotella sp.]|nr:iron ABC transporter permease [Alloprevotella sp.]
MKTFLPLLLLIALLSAALLTGSAALSAADVWAALTGTADDAARFIVCEARLPQALTAVLAGAGLAVAGLLMQTVFANPLADPSLLGVNSGAGLGVAVAMLLLGGTLVAGEFSLSGFVLTVAAAFAGSAFVILLLVAGSALMPGTLPLLITGVMISFATGALVSLLSFWSTAQGVQAYMLWGLGNFGGVTSARLPAFAALTVAGLAGAWLLSKDLNAMLLGDDYAQNAGVDVRRKRLTALLISGLLTAGTTALCGPIAFIGLAMPHAARLTLRTSDHRALTPATALWGADIALLCHILSQLPGERGILPINVLTPLVGVPAVFLILLRSRKGTL